MALVNNSDTPCVICNDNYKDYLQSQTNINDDQNTDSNNNDILYKFNAINDSLKPYYWRLVESSLKSIHVLSRKYASTELDYSELYNLLLDDAIYSAQRYKTDHGTKFNSYVGWKWKKSISSYFKNKKNNVKTVSILKKQTDKSSGDKRMTGEFIKDDDAAIPGDQDELSKEISMYLVKTFNVDDILTFIEFWNGGKNICPNCRKNYLNKFNQENLASFLYYNHSNYYSVFDIHKLIVN